MPRFVRPTADTMPSVTVWFSWYGLPMASTHSATFSADESPQGMVGRLLRVHLQQGQVRGGIDADHGGRHLALVGGQRHA